MVNEIQISVFLSIIVSSITFFGIKLIYKQMPWIISECSYNEKSSVFHQKMLRGLGVIYPISILPILFFENQLINFYDYFLLTILVLLGFIDDKYNLNYKIKNSCFYFNFFNLQLLFNIYW